MYVIQGITSEFILEDADAGRIIQGQGLCPHPGRRAQQMHTPAYTRRAGDRSDQVVSNLQERLQS